MIFIKGLIESRHVREFEVLIRNKRLKNENRVLIVLVLNHVPRQDLSVVLEFAQRVQQARRLNYQVSIVADGFVADECIPLWLSCDPRLRQCTADTLFRLSDAAVLYFRHRASMHFVSRESGPVAGRQFHFPCPLNTHDLHVYKRALSEAFFHKADLMTIIPGGEFFGPVIAHRSGIVREVVSYVPTSPPLP